MSVVKNIGIKKRSAALKISGADAFRFLNGMLTQDIQKTAEKFPSGARAFFLTNKGKVIAPLYFASLNQEELFIWTHEDCANSLKEGLERYIIADKVEIKALGSFDSWTLVESHIDATPLKTRHPLGLEKIFEIKKEGETYFLPQQRLSSTHTEVFSLDSSFKAEELSQEDYWKLCFESGTPEWGLDIIADDFFLEFPLSDAVSFDKGCYIGQETVARGTFRGKVNKSFARIRSDKPLTVGEITTESGNKVGQVRSAQGTLGRGIVKFDLPAENSFLLNGEKHTLQVEHLVDETTFRKGR